MANYQWGIATSAGTNWLMQSKTISNSGQEALALDGVGEPAALHIYQKTSELSFEAVIPTDESSIPEIGDTFTYSGTKYFVTAVSVTESNTDYVKYSLTCKRYTTAGIPT